MVKLLNKIKTGLTEDITFKNPDYWSIVIKCSILFLCMVISMVVPFFVYVTLLLGAVFVMLTNGMRKIYILIFLLPFYNVFRINAGQLFFSAYIMLLIVAVIGIRFIYELFTKKRKLDTVLTILVGAFCLYVLLPFSPFHPIKILTVFSCIAICYLYYVYRSECDFKEMVLLLAFSFILAGILSAFRCVSPRLEYFLPDITSYIYNRMRFSGLSRDPNYFGLEIMLVLSCLTVLFYKGKINFLFYPLITLFTVYGILTGSKTFIIVWAVWFIIMVFFVLMKKIKTKTKLYTFLTFLICCAIPFGICYKHSVFLYSRLFDVPYIYESGIIEDPSGSSTPGESSSPTIPDNQIDNIINIFSFTTGRSDIWKFYFDETTSELKLFLFGHGIGTNYLTVDYPDTAVHNTYLQSVYYFGLVGTLIYLSIFVYLFVKTRKKSTFSLINFLPLLTLGIFMWSLDTILSFRTFLLIILTACSLNQPSEKTLMKAYADKEKYESFPLSNKLVSIIVPVRNVQNSLNKCVSSILNQTYKNIEIILIENGSTDSSYKICLDLKEKHPNIVLKQVDCKGVSFARNQGLELTRGEYYQFVDSDDYIQNNMVERLVRAMEYNNSDLVICGARSFINKKSKCFSKPNNGTFTRETYKTLLPFLYENNLFNSLWNKLYKISNKPLFDEKFSLGEDMRFNADYIVNTEKITTISDLLYNYDMSYNPNSLTQSNMENRFNIVTENYKFMIKFYNSINLKDKVSLNNIYIRNVISTIAVMIKNGHNINSSDKQKFVKTWLEHDEVQKAVREAKPTNIKQFICFNLVKQKSVRLLMLASKFR